LDVTGCHIDSRASAHPPVIEKILGWCQQAEQGLSQTYYRDHDSIVSGVQLGVLELWRFDGGRAWMVTREESGDLVVCCFQGEGLREYAPHIFAAARRSGFRGIRFFTNRPGLARILSAYGFQPEQTVYRCEVNENEWNEQ